MDSTHYIQTGDKTIYTTVTAYAETVTDWISSVTNYFRSKQTVIFGLDIEWKPNWRAGVVNPAATLQICAGNRCLIVQLLHIYDIPPSLMRFLRNPRYVFAGVEIQSDAEKLSDEYGLFVENLFDVRAAALETAPERLSRHPGLKELAREVADVWLEKPQHVSVSDWSVEVLSEEQIEYACLDAYASCRVGLILYWDLQWD